jgi:hypothetical protein
MRSAAKALLLMEIVVCFAPALVLLALGLIVLPVQVWFLLDRAGEDGTGGALTVLALVIGGMAGVIALANLIFWITASRSSFLSRGWTLAGAVAGSAALWPYVFGPVDSTWWRLVGLMPLLCAVHLLYLGRNFLFPELTQLK